MKGSTHPTTVRQRETCVLVGVDVRSCRSTGSGLKPLLQLSSKESLDELAELAESAGAKVLGKTIQTRKTVDPVTVIGRGKVDSDVAQAAELAPGFSVRHDRHWEKSNIEK